MVYLGLHLLPQQGDVLDGLELCRVPEELVAVALALHFPQDVHPVVVPEDGRSIAFTFVFDQLFPKTHS